MNKDQIRHTLKTTQISLAQIDPFGYCNAKCWFCPVKYETNPAKGKKQMPPELLEKIFKNLIDERSETGLVHPSFSFFYTAHYNEVLLYKHFESLCKLATDYNLTHMILSNGTTLTKDKVDIIKKYQSHVAGICLNIPSFRKEEWAEFTGFPQEKFSDLLDNIYYAVRNLDVLMESNRISIQINGTNSLYANAKTGIQLGDNAPKLDLDPILGTLVCNKKIGERLFPWINIYEQPSLVDRAGLLPLNVLSNSNIINNKKQDKTRTSGCYNGINDKGRPFSWLHVNATGKVFLCCNDYHMDHEIGDLSTQNLRDFWGSDHHVDVIDKAFSGICTKCASASWD